MAALLLLFTESPGQVLRELPPVELEYRLIHGEPPVPVGFATAAFKVIDTPRGRQLEVRSQTKYTLPRKPPFEYEEEATVLCDAKGATRFETIARALGDERVNTGIRLGQDYQVATTFRGKKTTKKITAGVQRTNFGLYCAAFLEDRLEDSEMYQDFPLLFPVAATHMPRHLLREGILPFEVAKGRTVSVTVCRLEAADKTSDRIYNTTQGHRILVRMEEKSNLGMIAYELVQVNGVPVGESDLIQ